jgi:hypothetical protein
VSAPERDTLRTRAPINPDLPTQPNAKHFAAGGTSVETLAQDFRDLLSQAHEGPCLSLYQPTHRHHPDNRQDPIRFKNLLAKLQAALRLNHPDHGALLASFYALAEDRAFWNQTLDGLAVLANGSLQRVYRLQRSTPELAIVADSFHVKPLIRILQSADRYQVLALTRTTARMYEGNRDVVDPLPLEPEVPGTMENALGPELTEPYLTGTTRTGSGGAIFHGHGSKKDERDIDTERYFRIVDRAVWEHHSRPSELPLILAALPEHHAMFRRVSTNPLLARESIAVNPDTLDEDKLRHLGWEAERPRYLALTADLVERFNNALPSGRASDELTQVAAAAAHGRIATLLLDADHHIPGRIDKRSGAIQTASEPEVDDLLDDLGELVLERGGRAVVIPTERMPTRTGAAAIYRY